MSKYDRIIQENIQPLALSLIKKMIGLKDEEVAILSRKMQRTLEREADMVIQVKSKNGYTVIYNIEWQTYNDKKMCKRMALQHVILHLKYALPVVGIVIYTGRRKMNMPSEIKHEGFSYKYQLIDLSQYPAEEFLQSPEPDEIVMSVLAGRPTRETARLQIREILFKLHALLGNDESELNRRITQLEVLSEIKGFQDITIEEEKNMPIILDNSKSIRYQQGYQAGEAKGEIKGIQETTIERNTAFVTYLLQNTTHTAEQIAGIVNVPVSFVLEIKNKIN